jgi:hypothetical protein
VVLGGGAINFILRKSGSSRGATTKIQKLKIQLESSFTNMMDTINQYTSKMSIFLSTLVWRWVSPPPLFQATLMHVVEWRQKEGSLEPTSDNQLPADGSVNATVDEQLVGQQSYITNTLSIVNKNID